MRVWKRQGTQRRRSGEETEGTAAAHDWELKGHWPLVSLSPTVHHSPRCRGEEIQDKRGESTLAFMEVWTKCCEDIVEQSSSRGTGSLFVLKKGTDGKVLSDWSWDRS